MLDKTEKFMQNYNPKEVAREYKFIYLQNLLLNSSSLYPGSPTQVSQISHKHLCCFCFTGTTLSTNQNRVALSLTNHRPIFSLMTKSVRINVQKLEACVLIPPKKIKINRYNIYSNCKGKQNEPVCNITNRKNMRTQFP